jgi:hypothetical protein
MTNESDGVNDVGDVQDVIPPPPEREEDVDRTNEIVEKSRRRSRFSLVETAKEGWSASNGSMIEIHMALFVIMTLSFILSIILNQLPSYSVSGMVAGDIPPYSIDFVSVITGLLATILLRPAWVSLCLARAKSVSGNKVPISQEARSAYKSIARVAGSVAFKFVITIMGFMLFIIPGIYFMVAYLFSEVSVTERKGSWWEDMEFSRRGATKNWFRLAGLLLGLLCLNILALIPLGIGLIWSIPMTINSMAVAYRDIYGDENLIAS